MEIKTKFNIGQTVYIVLIGEQVDKRQIKAITITEGYVEYKFCEGETEREEYISDTYDGAIDTLIQQEERRHKNMIEYFQKQKENKK